MIFQHRYLVLTAVLFTTSVFSGRAQAQATSAAKSIELTAFVGASTYFPDEANHKQEELKFETDIPYGGRVAYNFTAHHGVEFSIANPLSFYGNYVYNFSPIRSRWVPYVTAGIGGGRYSNELAGLPEPNPENTDHRESGPDSQSTTFTGNFGGGLKVWLVHRLALRFDVRDIVGRHQASLAGAPGASPFTDSRILHDVQLTGGVVFRFGGN